MLAALVDARRHCQHLLVGEPGGGHDPLEHRPAFGQGSRLVDDKGVNLAHRLDGGGIAKQHALRGGAAGGGHDRHRRRQPQRAWAGDDQHRHRIDKTKYPARFGAKDAPSEQSEQRNADHHHDEVTGDDVGQALHRCARTLRLRDHLHDERQHGLRADFLGADHQAAAGIERRSDDLVADAFRRRNGLAR